MENFILSSLIHGAGSNINAVCCVSGGDMDKLMAPIVARICQRHCIGIAGCLVVVLVVVVRLEFELVLNVDRSTRVGVEKVVQREINVVESRQLLN